MYLSVDIDFWNHIGVEDLSRTLRLIKNSNKVVKICDNHKGLVRSVNQSGQTELVNVDTHSDLMTLRDIDFWKEKGYKMNCGNWVNFVKKSLRSSYLWVHPEKYGIRCDCRNFRCDPFKKPQSVGWGDVKKESHIKFHTELIEQASHIGIAVSYYHLEEQLDKEIVKNIFKNVFGKIPRHTEKTHF